MCTVTFIPTSKGFCFTSSRDEKSSRSTIYPAQYSHKKINLIYPKDELAGGTWIAMSENGRTACLLNGAFIAHQKKESYVKSRGVILLESFQYSNILEFKKNVDLQNIEPFTLLLLDYRNSSLNHFFEFIWDGKTKHFKELSKTENQIWSSATLYNSEVQGNRKKLFDNWILEHYLEEDKQILNFHNRKHGLKKSEDIVMIGDGDLKTLSISEIQLSNQNVTFNYHDILKNQLHVLNINKQVE